MSRPVLLVVVGSTRPGRVGAAVAQWFVALAITSSEFDVEVGDLAEYALPLYDEPRQPMTGRYEHEHTKRWARAVDRADAIVLVVPEYNHSFNAATKNALDYLFHEWRHKAAGLVSYGGTSAGSRAAAGLKSVLAALKMVPAGDVHVPFVSTHVSEGVFSAPEATERQARNLLQELAHLTQALEPLRDADRAARAARAAHAALG
jgi:NAD(P)H-dependent FMN reductase